MDFLPSFSEFSNKLKKNKNQIVYTKFSADLDTPVSLMMKLAKEEKNSFLLESVTGGEIKGRYSVIGMKPDLIWKCNLEESEINRKVLEKSNWVKSDVDLYEVNEAFAVVPMATMKDIGIPTDIINIHGGACALGHPVGASGSRIVATLINALKNNGLKKGVASLCIGGGEATALALELVN